MDPNVDWLLLERWCAGECSVLEAAAVEQWIAADPANAQLARVMRLAWQRAAAGGGQPSRDVTAAWGSLAAKLRTSDSTGPPPRVLELVPKRRRTSLPNWAVGAAAACLLTVGSGATWYLVARNRADAPTVAKSQLIATVAGQRAALTLSDGSQVTVGVASRIRFAPMFGRTRDVYLDGEAFFQVAHDASRPFIVHTRRGSARALGTKFNVYAYDDSPDMAVLVTEGAVALKATAMLRDSLILRRADLGRVRSDGGLVQSAAVDSNAYLAWMRGQLVFDRMPVPEAVRQLTRWYGVDVRLGDSVLVRHALTASLGGQPLADALHTVAGALNATIEQRGTVYLLVARRPSR